jgi:hypothetical protein
MDDQELRKLLEQLHSEIEDAQTVDEKGLALLRDLEADIRALLERSGTVPADLHPTTLKRMEDGLQYFEVTHPTLTEMLSKLLAILSNAGI